MQELSQAQLLQCMPPYATKEPRLDVTFFLSFFITYPLILDFMIQSGLMMCLYKKNICLEFFILYLSIIALLIYSEKSLIVFSP